MTDSTVSESLLEEGLSDDIVYLNDISFQGNIAEKYCLYDMDSLMLYIKNYGEVCYHTICLLSSTTHLYKVIPVRTSIEEGKGGYYYSVVRYIFENGYEYDAKRADIDTRKEAEEITDILEQAAPFIFYMEGHISVKFISFDYEHWE